MKHETSEVYTESQLRELYGFHFRRASAEALSDRFACENLLHTINHSLPGEIEIRRDALTRLFGSLGKNVHVQPPFYCDFGKNISIGEGSFLNFNCTILDCAEVTIGKRVWIAPNVQIYAATHPVDAVERQNEFLSKPIDIGDDVWLGGGVIVCPGVTIGARSVIGAGSVVTRDIPADVVAYGNPCKVARKLKP